MTMIACTMNRNVPILMSDILISGSKRPDKFILPSRNENILGLLKDLRDDGPVCLFRKIYIPKRNVCIAFAGNVHIISLFLEDLLIFCKANPTADGLEMQRFCLTYGLTPDHEISFLMVVADIVGDEYKFTRIKYGEWNVKMTPLFGEIISAGSGSQDFVREAMEDAEFISGQAADTIERALQANIILICKLLSTERVSLSHVKNFWGAGFEMVYLIREGFTRFENITYLINHADFNNTGETQIPIPEIIMNYKYVGEVLVITAINPLKGTTEENGDNIIIRYTEFNIKQFIVEPIFSSSDVDYNKLAGNPSFTSHINAMGYVISCPNGDFLPASFNAGPELLVEYQHDKSVTITIRKEINDTIADLSKKWFNAMNF